MAYDIRPRAEDENPDIRDNANASLAQGQQQVAEQAQDTEPAMPSAMAQQQADINAAKRREYEGNVRAAAKRRNRQPSAKAWGMVKGDLARQQERLAAIDERILEADPIRRQENDLAAQKDDLRVEQARQAEATRQHAAQGGETVTDPLTGRRTIAKDENGRPLFKAGEVGDPKLAVIERAGPTPDGKPLVSAALQQPVRNKYGEMGYAMIEQKTDPATGEIYSETKDQFGQTKRIPFGTDQKIKRSLELDREIDLAAQAKLNFDLQAQQHEPRYKAAKEQFDAAAKDYNVAPKYIQIAGKWVENSEGIPTDPAEQAKWAKTQYIKDPQDLENWKRKRQADQNAYGIAKKNLDVVAPEWDNLAKQREAAATAEDRARLRKKRLELDLPEDDGGVARILLKAEDGTITDDQTAVAEYLKSLPTDERVRAERGILPEQQAASSQPEQPAEHPLVPPTDDASTLAAFTSSFRGLQNPEQFTVGATGKTFRELKRNGSTVATFYSRSPEDTFIAINEYGGADLQTLVNTQADGGFPVYIRDNFDNPPSPSKEAAWAAEIYGAINRPELQTPEALGALLEEKQASPPAILKRIKSGELSVNMGGKLLKEIYGMELQTGDYNDPALFQKWLQQTSERELKYGTALIPQNTTAAKWNKASKDRLSLSQQENIKNDFAADYVLANPLLTRAQQKALYSQNKQHDVSTWERLRSMGNATIDLGKDVVGSSIGMPLGLAEDALYGAGAIFSEEDRQILAKKMKLRNMSTEAWRQGVVRFTKALATDEGRAASTERTLAMREWQAIVDRNADLAAPDKAAEDAAAQKAIAATLRLHNLARNPDDPIEARHLDPAQDKALRLAMGRYKATADPRAWALLDERMLMSNDRRWVSAEMEELAGPKGGFWGAVNRGMSAGWEEVLSEAASWATLGAFGALAKGGKALNAAAKVNKVVQATRIGKLGGAIYRDLQKAAVAFDKLGTAVGTLEKPLTAGQRAGNALLRGGKVAAIGGVTEGYEELVPELGADNPQFLQAFGTGLLGGIMLLPVGAAQTKLGEAAASYQQQAKLQDSYHRYAREYNRVNADLPGFQPIDAKTAEFASLFVNPQAREAGLQQLTAETAALREFIAAEQSATAAGQPMDPALPKAEQRLASLEAISTALAQEDIAAIDAVAGFSELAPEEKTNLVAFAKAAAGRADLLTPQERRSIQAANTAAGAPVFQSDAVTPEGMAMLAEQYPVLAKLPQFQNVAGTTSPTPVDGTTSPGSSPDPASDTANVPRLTGTPEQQQAAGTIAQQVMAEIASEMPAIAGRVGIGTASTRVSGGVTASIDAAGQTRIQIIPEDIAHAIASGMTPEQAKARVKDNIVLHETIHTLQFQVVAQQAAAAGDASTPDVAAQTFYGGMHGQMQAEAPQMLEQGRALYGEQDDGSAPAWDTLPEWAQAAEVVRMLTEAKIAGRTTDVSRLLDGASPGLLQKLAQIVKDMIAAITTGQMPESVKQHVDTLTDLYNQLANATPDPNNTSSPDSGNRPSQPAPGQTGAGTGSTPQTDSNRPANRDGGTQPPPSDDAGASAQPAEVAAAQTIVRAAFDKALESRPLLKKDADLMSGLRQAAMDIRDAFAGRPEAEIKDAAARAIGAYLQSPEVAERLSALEAAQSAKARQYREAAAARVREEARRIIVQRMPTVRDMESIGRITRPTNALELYRTGQTLPPEWNGMLRSSDYAGGGKNAVARAIIGMIYAADETSGSTPDQIASGLEAEFPKKYAGFTPDMLWKALEKELRGYINGADASSLDDPDADVSGLTDEQIQQHIDRHQQQATTEKWRGITGRNALLPSTAQTYEAEYQKIVAEEGENDFLDDDYIARAIATVDGRNRPKPKAEPPLSSFIDTSAQTPDPSPIARLWNGIQKLRRGNYQPHTGAKLNTLAPFSFGGGKAALLNEYLLPILTRLTKRSKRVVDLFGGGGSYTHALAENGVLPPGSILNEYEWHRALTHKWVKEAPAEVASHMQEMQDQEMESLRSLPTIDAQRQRHVQIVNQWLNEQVDPDEQNQWDEWNNYRRVALKDEARTAALYLYVQGLAFGNRSLEVSRTGMIEQGDMLSAPSLGTAQWTEGVADDGTPKTASTGFIAAFITEDGISMPNRVKEPLPYLKAASKRTQGVTILGPWSPTKGDAMRVLDEIVQSGDLVLYDPPYLPNPVTGSTGNYGEGTGDFGNPQKALNFIRQHAQSASDKGALIVSTNNYHPFFSAGLEAAGWENAGAYRAKSANLQNSELISFSHPVLSLPGTSGQQYGNHDWTRDAAPAGGNQAGRSGDNPGSAGPMAAGTEGRPAAEVEGQQGPATADRPADVQPQGGTELPETDSGLNGTRLASAPATGTNGRPAIQTTDGRTLEAPGTVALFSPAFHGTPHKVDRFSTDKIGTGEGAQAYGWGLYFAERLGVAKSYMTVGQRESLVGLLTMIQQESAYYVESKTLFGKQLTREDSDKKLAKSFFKKYLKQFPETKVTEELVLDVIKNGIANKTELSGNLYKVDLKPAEDEYLDWDKPLSEQSEKVRRAMESTAIYKEAMAEQDAVNKEAGYAYLNREKMTGEQWHAFMSLRLKMDQPAVSKALHSAGIRGIRYLDGNSRNRPFRDIKRDFLNALPEDAEFMDVADAIEEGSFNKDQVEFLNALKEDDWLGFDYPAQAISAALTEKVSNFDPSQRLLASIEKLRGDVSYNYVIFDEADIEIVEENGQPVKPSTVLGSAPVQNPSALAQSLLDSIGEQALRVEQPGKSYEDKRQLIIDFSKSLLPAKGTAAVPDRPLGPISVLRARVAGTVASDLRVKFIGETIEGLEDLVEKAQVLRNPGFETFYLLATRIENGKAKVLDAMAVTSRVPLSSAIFEQNKSWDEGAADHVAFLRNAGADSYILLHNHPAGDPTPSTADIRVTREHARRMDAAGFELIDHVVINHLTYATLDANGIVSRGQIQSDAIDPYPWPVGTEIGMEGDGPVEIAAIAKNIQEAKDRPDLLVGFFLNSDLKIVASVQGSAQDIKNLTRSQLQEIGRRQGGHVFILHGQAANRTEAMNLMRELAPMNQGGLLTDAIIELRDSDQFLSGEDTSFFIQSEDGIFPARTPGIRVQESPAAQYRYLKAKQEKAGLTPAEQQALLRAEQAMGQSFAIDMDDPALRTPRGSVSPSFQPSLNLQSEAPDNARQMELFSAPVTPAQDAEYLAAVERGDMQTAQRMVDEAAKKMGYNIGPVWNGSPEPITTFDPSRIQPHSGGVFNFSAQESYAANFGTPRPYYLKAERTANADQWQTAVRGKLKNPMEANQALATQGFDSVHTTDPETPENEVWGVLDPSQIKSADPVTYDAQGNVIPLSRRFNPESDSILYSAPASPGNQRLIGDYSEEEWAILTEDFVDDADVFAWDGGARGGSRPAYEEADEIQYFMDEAIESPSKTVLEAWEAYRKSAGPRRKMIQHLDSIIRQRLKDNASLGSAPSQQPDDQAALEAALRGLDPIYGDVLKASQESPTPSPAALAQRFNLPERAIHNIIGTVRTRIQAQGRTIRPGGLQPQRTADGRLKGGMPQRGNSTTPILAAVDQLQQQEGLPLSKTNREIHDAARRIATRPDALDFLLAAQHAGAPTAEETAAAAHYLREASIRGDQSAKLTELAILYREQGTRQSEEFRARIDQYRTPSERNALIFQDILTAPNKQTREAYEAAKTPEAKLAILEAWNARVKGIKEAMKARGIDLDAALARLAEQRANVQAGQAYASEAHQKLVDGLNAEVASLRQQLAAAQDGAAKDAAQAKLDEAEQNAARAAELDPRNTIRLELEKLRPDERAAIEILQETQDLNLAAARTYMEVRELVKLVDRFMDAIATAGMDAMELAENILLGRAATLQAPAANAPDSVKERYRKAMAMAKISANLDIDALKAKAAGKPAKGKGKASAKPTGPEPAMMSDAEFRARQNNPQTWRPLWQAEATLTGQRISFEEWQAKPETQAIKARQDRMFKQPVSTTTGELDMHDPVSVKRAFDAFSIHSASLFDKAMEFWRTSILSGPQTAIVNFGGNIAHSLYHLGPRRILEAGVNDVLGIIGLGSKDAATLGELRVMARQAHKALGKAGSDMVRSWAMDDRVVEAEVLALGKQMEFSGLGADHSPQALGGILGTVMRGISFRHMTASDEFLKSFHAHVEVAAHAYRMAKAEGLKGDAMESRIAELMGYGSPAWQKAYTSAEWVTFQSRPDKSDKHAISFLDRFAKGIRRFAQTDTGRTMEVPRIDKDGKIRKEIVPIMKPNAFSFFFPFINTPLNIFKIGIEMSPIGALFSIVDAARALKERMDKGHLTPEAAKAAAADLYDKQRLVKDITNQIIGAGLFWALGTLVKPDDDDELPFITGSMDWKRTSKGDRDLRAKVMPAYSIRIGDAIFSYQRVEPFGTALGFLVDMRLGVDKHGGINDAALGEFMTTAINQLDNKTYLQGVSDLFNLIHDPERFGTKMAGNLVTGFVPNLIRQPIREADPYVRDTAPAAEDGFMEAVGKRIGYSLAPGYAPPMLDVWGNPILRNPGEKLLGSPQTDLVLRVFDPTHLAIGKDIDPIDRYLFNWNNSQADQKARFNIEPIRDTLTITRNGKKHILVFSQEDHIEANRNAGQAAREVLGNDWNPLQPTEEGVERIKETLRDFQKRERDRLRAKYESTLPAE